MTCSPIRRRKKGRPLAFSEGARVLIVDFDFERGSIEIAATVQKVLHDRQELLVKTDIGRDLQIHQSLVRHLPVQRGTPCTKSR